MTVFIRIWPALLTNIIVTLCTTKICFLFYNLTTKITIQYTLLFKSIYILERFVLSAFKEPKIIFITPAFKEPKIISITLRAEIYLTYFTIQTWPICIRGTLYTGLSLNNLFLELMF